MEIVDRARHSWEQKRWAVHLVMFDVYNETEREKSGGKKKQQWKSRRLRAIGPIQSHGPAQFLHEVNFQIQNLLTEGVEGP